MSARGVLYVHSCPPAICPHVEWALARVLDAPSVHVEWTAQPMAPSHLRTDTGWRGRPGTAARIAAALRGWSPLRFEVTEEPSEGCDGERYVRTPSLGVFASSMSANGDVLVQEDRLRAVVRRCGDLPTLQAELDRLLGSAWDHELEPYRQAGDGSPLRWLHATG